MREYSYLVIYKTPVDLSSRRKKNIKSLIGRRYNLIRADRSKDIDLYLKAFSQNQNLRAWFKGLSDVIRFDQRPRPFAFLLLSSQSRRRIPLSGFFGMCRDVIAWDHSVSLCQLWQLVSRLLMDGRRSQHSRKKPCAHLRPPAHRQQGQSHCLHRSEGREWMEGRCQTSGSPDWQKTDL